MESHFHELKNDFWSAHSYKAKKEDAQKLLLLVSTAMNLVKYSKHTVFTDDAMSIANKKRLTKKIVRLLLSRILVDLPVDSPVACCFPPRLPDIEPILTGASCYVAKRRYFAE